MAKHSAANERVKNDYFKLLKEAKGYDEASIDAVAASIDRFETFTKRRAFNRFHIEQTAILQPAQRSEDFGSSW